MIQRFIDSSVIGPSLRLTLTASEDTRHSYGKINIRDLVERIGEVAEAEFIECAVSLFEHSVVGVIAVVQPRDYTRHFSACVRCFTSRTGKRYNLRNSPP